MPLIRIISAIDLFLQLPSVVLFMFPNDLYTCEYILQSISITFHLLTISHLKPER